MGSTGEHNKKNRFSNDVKRYPSNGSFDVVRHSGSMKKRGKTDLGIPTQKGYMK